MPEEKGGEFFDVRKLIEMPDPPLITWIIGQRGCGKTYSTARYLRDRLVNFDEKFVLIKSWKNEIGSQGVDNILREIFGKFKYEVDSKGVVWLLKTTKRKKVEKREAGYIVALSTATAWNGGKYENAVNFFYDECVNTAYKEFPDKIGALFNVITTFCRDDPRGKAILTSNALFSSGSGLMADMGLGNIPLNHDVLYRQGDMAILSLGPTTYNNRIVKSRVAKASKGTPWYAKNVMNKLQAGGYEDWVMPNDYVCDGEELYTVSWGHKAYLFKDYEGVSLFVSEITEYTANKLDVPKYHIIARTPGIASELLPKDEVDVIKTLCNLDQIKCDAITTACNLATIVNVFSK